MQGKLSRLGREAGSASWASRGTGKRLASSPTASERDSGGSEEDEEKEEEAFKEGNEQRSGRLTRRAAAQRDAAPGSKRKSRHKV